MILRKIDAIALNYIRRLISSNLRNITTRKSNNTKTITARKKKEEIETIATKYGDYNLRIIGSVAREEETETSVLDFLIDYDINKITAWFPSGLIQDLEALFNRKVDIVTTNS